MKMIELYNIALFSSFSILFWRLFPFQDFATKICFHFGSYNSVVQYTCTIVCHICLHVLFFSCHIVCYFGKSLTIYHFSLHCSFSHLPKYSVTAVIITARIRRMTGGYVFTRICYLWGCIPIRLMGGTPFLSDGVGTPIPGQERGVPPSQIRIGGGGYRPGQVRDQDGGVPPTGTAQHVLATCRVVRLLRSRRRTFFCKHLTLFHCQIFISTNLAPNDGTLALSKDVNNNGL